MTEADMAVAEVEAHWEGMEGQPFDNFAQHLSAKHDGKWLTLATARGRVFVQTPLTTTEIDDPPWRDAILAAASRGDMGGWRTALAVALRWVMGEEA